MRRGRTRWRVAVEVDFDADASKGQRTARLKQLRRELNRSLGRRLRIRVRSDELLLLGVANRRDAQRLTAGARRVVRAAGLWGKVRMEERDREDWCWHVRDGPPRVTVSDESGERDGVVVVWARGERARLRTAMLVAAAVGIAGYAVWPGDLSYQFLGLLTFPAIFVGLWWLFHHVPRRLQMPLAIVFAPIGPVLYVVFDGARLWGLAGITPLPLVLLLMSRIDWRKADRGPWVRNPPGTGPIGPP